METPRTTLVALSNASFQTSKHADDLCNEWLRRLGLKARHEPARLAVARSLSIPSAPPAIPMEYQEEDGRTIRGVNFFGDDLGVWAGLLVEHAGRAELTVRDVQELVRLHWHRGAVLLDNEWNNLKGDFDRFLLQLASRAGIREGGKLGADLGSHEADLHTAAPAPIVLRLGEVGLDLQTQQPVTWIMNASGHSPHVAIMGASGKGKTRTGKELIRQVRQQTGCPVLLLDMAQGDLAKDDLLVSELGATVIRAPDEPIPLDVLHIPAQTEAEARDAAFRFRDSFKSVSESRPGGKQLDALRDAANRAFLSGKSPIRIADIRDKLKEIYAEQRQKPDVVSATFNDLTQYSLFEPKYTPQEFFSRSWIIDLHGTSSNTVQRLIVFLLLDALYSHFRAMDPAPMDEAGHRALRVCVGIDEARKVLGYGQQSLISLVRETRSKGVSVFLMSQSPDDFDAEEDNFLEQIGLALSFNTSATKAKALKAFLGHPVDLTALATGVAVTRFPGQTSIVRIKAWEPSRR